MMRHRSTLLVGLALLGGGLVQQASAAPRITSADPALLDQWFAMSRFNQPWGPVYPQSRYVDFLRIELGTSGAYLNAPLPTSESGGPVSVRAGDALLLVAHAAAHPNPRAIQAAEQVAMVRMTIDGVDVLHLMEHWAGPRPAQFPHRFVHLVPYVPSGTVPGGEPTIWWPSAFTLPEGGLDGPADVYLGGVVLRIDGLEVGDHKISWSDEFAWERVLPIQQGFPIFGLHHLLVRVTP